MKTVEVVALVGRGIQLGVEQAGRQHRIEGVVAVARGVRRGGDVLVQLEVRVVGVVVVGLGAEQVFLDGTLGCAGVVREGSGSGNGEVCVVVRGIAGHQQRRRVR